MKNDIDRQIDPWGRVIFGGADAIELLLRGHDLSTLLIERDATPTRYSDAPSALAGASIGLSR